MIRFDSKAQIILSDDLPEDVLSLLEEEQVNAAVLVVDENVAGHWMIVESIEKIKNQIELTILKISSEEPSTNLVNRYTEQVKGTDIDLFIGIGGGSVLDLTKALSVMVINDGNVEDYHGTGRNFESGIKKILIPTTAGTGSEVTPGAVLVNKNNNYKRSISGRHVAADYAILNPHLTMSMPDELIASTGMDALGHAIESYTSKCSNEITRIYSKQAFSLVFNNLTRVFENKQDVALRKKILLGSCMAGFAIYNSNTGACHSMAYPLGIFMNIPHGIAVGKLLPKVVRVNVNKGCDLYADLYDLTDEARGGISQSQKAELFCELMEDYPPAEYIHKRFSDYGVDYDNCEFLAKRGLDLEPALKNNPVDFGFEDALKVLKELL